MEYHQLTHPRHAIQSLVMDPLEHLSGLLIPSLARRARGGQFLLSAVRNAVRHLAEDVAVVEAVIQVGRFEGQTCNLKRSSSST